MSSGERLQKVLARAGVASRRHAEELITAARVRVNSRIVTELGTRVDPRRDRIEVDGRRIIAEPIVYYMFHKPRGTVSTLDDPEGRATIADYLKEIPARVFPIGRLDFHTSGALLLTNDGDLAQALLHPRRSVAKTYVAKVRGVPTDLQLQPWREGMQLPAVPDGPPAVKTRPAEVEVLRHAPSGLGAQSESGTTWLKITLREGRNRQIHRMAEAVGLFVMRLARIAFAGLTTEGLRPGELRPLTDKEVTMLRATYLRPVEQAKAAGAGAKNAGSEAEGEDEWTESYGESEGDEDSPFAPEKSERSARHGRPGKRERAEQKAQKSRGAREPRSARSPSPPREGLPTGTQAARIWTERESAERSTRTQGGPGGFAKPRGPNERAAGPGARAGGERRESPASRGREDRGAHPKSRGGEKRAAFPNPRSGGTERSAFPKPRGREERPAHPQGRSTDERHAAPKPRRGGDRNDAPKPSFGAPRSAPSKPRPRDDRGPREATARGSERSRNPRGPRR